MIEEQRLEWQLNLLLEYFIIIQRILEDIQSNEIDVNSLRNTKIEYKLFCTRYLLAWQYETMHIICAAEISLVLVQCELRDT